MNIIDRIVQRYPILLALALLVGWNFILMAFRFHHTRGSWYFIFIWNLFLAVLPYFFAISANYFAQMKRLWLAFVLLAMAVLFLPNSPYVITDLFHLRPRSEMPFWYDTLVLFSLALSGLIMFYLALFQIRRFLLRISGKLLAESGIIVMIFLCSFGIYLGRYLRFNSWDVVSNPYTLVNEITDRVINPLDHPQTLGVTVLYGAFLLLGYWVIKLLEIGVETNRLKANFA